MKKLFILLMVLFLVSCSVTFENDEGFNIFGYGLTYLTDNNVLVQSHDGYVINDIINYEGIFNKPVTIINVLNRPINVKITEKNNYRWVVIEDYLLVENILIEDELVTDD